jgi:hypothetical protein
MDGKKMNIIHAIINVNHVQIIKIIDNVRRVEIVHSIIIRMRKGNFYLII